MERAKGLLDSKLGREMETVVVDLSGQDVRGPREVAGARFSG